MLTNSLYIASKYHLKTKNLYNPFNVLDKTKVFLKVSMFFVKVDPNKISKNTNSLLVVLGW